MSVLVTAGALAAAGSATAVANAASGGPNWVGIASVITACSGAVGTLIMGYVAIVRLNRSGEVTKDDITEAVIEGLEHQHRLETDDEA